ncbi:MAG TPA: hypothetical protein VJL37_08120 [Flavobacterium sp.]|nr:hypothetical protein [Flavobacterium sp.]
MKKNNQNALAFNKMSVVELNDENLLMINGGTNPVIIVPLIPVVGGAVAFAGAIAVVALASLAEGATDAIRTK